MEVYSKSGKLLAVYHKNCTHHGSMTLEEFPMVKTRREGWFTIRQLQIFGRNLIDPVLKKSDKSKGLIEYTVYRYMNKEEKDEYNRAETPNDKDNAGID